MAELEMEDVLRGHDLFVQGCVSIQEVLGTKVIGRCSEGDDDFDLSIADVQRPFDRFVCTCPVFAADCNRFCTHLVALYYHVQEVMDRAPRLFGDPDEEGPILQAAEDQLFDLPPRDAGVGRRASRRARGRGAPAPGAA